jgi:hypothetical protein
MLVLRLGLSGMCPYISGNEEIWARLVRNLEAAVMCQSNIDLQSASEYFLSIIHRKYKRPRIAKVANTKHREKMA